MQLILTPPPKVRVILKETSFNFESPDLTYLNKEGSYKNCNFFLITLDKVADTINCLPVKTLNDPDWMLISRLP